MLESNQLTMLWQFQVHGRSNSSIYIYMCIHSPLGNIFRFKRDDREVELHFWQLEEQNMESWICQKYNSGRVNSGWFLGLPWCPVFGDLPCSAEDEGLIPGWGAEILHAMKELSLCAAIMCTNLMQPNK